jgi:group I intron endonuclease
MTRLQLFFNILKNFQLFLTIELFTSSLHLEEILKITIEEIRKKSGIYGFICKTTGKLYVGSSINLSYRFSQHIKGSRSNILLQKAIKKYKLEDFIFIVFEYCDPKDLLFREQYYLNCLKPQYNINPTAGSWLGAKHSTETIANMSLAKTGENNPMFGKNLTVETKARISEANKGKTASAETKAKLSKAQKSIDRIGTNNPASKKSIYFFFYLIQRQKNIYCLIHLSLVQKRQNILNVA